MSSVVGLQAELFHASEPAFDGEFTRAERIFLDAEAWIDFAPRWLAGADIVFDRVLEARRFGQRSRWMYDGEVLEPRLTSRWTLESGEPLEPSPFEAIRQALSVRYGVTFDSAGFNLYRDGRDSVAWHRDKIRREVRDPVVALLSLGEPRRLLFRPRAGGASRAFSLGRGDLLVTGGSCQRTWEHAVPKVARAGPRVSVAFRHGLDLAGYDARGRAEP